MWLERIAPTLPGQPYEIRSERFHHARLFPSRLALADYVRFFLPPHPVLCEIGVFRGDFTAALLPTFRPSQVYLIDLVRQPEVQHIPNAVFLEGDSSQVIGQIPDQSLDYLYIDGDHSYDGVSKDLKAALPKMKTSSVIQFNDYCTWSPAERCEYGVLQIANAFIEKYHPDILGLSLDRSGYHDLAIRLR